MLLIDTTTAHMHSHINYVLASIVMNCGLLTHPLLHCWPRTGGCGSTGNDSQIVAGGSKPVSHPRRGFLRIN